MKLLVKEIIIPRQSNNLLFVIGPFITLVFAFFGWAIIPFGEGLSIFDYELGVFFALAVSSIGSYGILVSGWAANSKYSFMGAIRSTAQLLSYELVFSSIVLVLIIFSGSFSLTYIVECQQAVWNIFPLLPIGLMFFIAILAETNRSPFDLPEARFGQISYFSIIYGKVIYIKFIICWKIYCYLLHYIYLFEYSIILNKTISKNLNIYLNLQRLYMNWIIDAVDIKVSFPNFNNSNWLLMKKSNFLFFNNNNSNNFNSFINISLKRICIKKPIIPKKVYENIQETHTKKIIETELQNFKGIYGFLCKINNKIYIGSSNNLVKRFKEHIKGYKSNIKLQWGIKKYGLKNYYYIIFDYYKINDIILLTDIETSYITLFKSKYLYNFKMLAKSMVGYKHTFKAKKKMINWYKENEHPLLGKRHSLESIEKIKLATVGIKNPMYGKKHRNESKYLISLALSKSVYMYKLVNEELSHIFYNSIKVAKFLNLHKIIVGRYIKQGKIITLKGNKYIFRRIPFGNDR